MQNVEGSAPLRSVEVVRGTIGDRPWGATLAAIGRSGRTGQLALRGADDQRYAIAFVNGLVVGASSPMSEDSVVKIALSSRLISSVQARTYGRIDDLDRFMDATKLAPQQTQQLKRRILIQRVARSFSVDVGEYTIDDRITIPVILGIEVDIRAAIYLGMRMNVSQQRLTRTLRRIGGARFMLEPAGINELYRFEFGEDEQVVLDALHNGTSVPELEAMDHEIDPRMVEAVLCTLAVSEAVSMTDLACRTPTTKDASRSRTPTRREPESTILAAPMLNPQDPSLVPAPTPAESFVAHPVPAAPSGPRMLTRPTDPFLEPQPARCEALSLAEIKDLIEVGTILLEQQVDHFSFLGLSFGAPVEEVREAYLDFARYLHPDNLVELGITDQQARDAQRVLAEVVIAYSVLTDPVGREDYLSTLFAIRARARR